MKERWPLPAGVTIYVHLNNISEALPTYKKHTASPLNLRKQSLFIVTVKRNIQIHFECKIDNLLMLDWAVHAVTAGT